MLVNRFPRARWRSTVLFVLALGTPIFSLGTQTRSASADATAAPAFPPAIHATFPLGITGLAAHRDGSLTLWVLNMQPDRVVVDGASVFGVIDVILRGQPGEKLRLLKGANCSAQTNNGQPEIECLPDVQPGQLVPVMTFRSSAPTFSSRTNTAELNSTAAITVAPNVAIPASDTTPARIRTYLARRAAALGLQSTIVYVDAGRPTEYRYKLSRTTIPRGWVTFVVTNRGKVDHSFQVCPSSGQLKDGSLLNACLQASSGSSYAAEVDDTLPLKPGKSSFFSMRFTEPGKYEYLSDITGQPQKGAKAQLTVK